MAGVPIVLQRWSPIFDAAQEMVGKEPIWVRLPGLPLHLWNIQFFRMLGDHLGEFVDANFSFREFGEMAVARVLVLLDLREGLTTNVLLSTDYGDYPQMLDYEGVPFRCHRCHSVDHLVAECDLSFRGKWRVDIRGEGDRVDSDSPKKFKSTLQRSMSPSPVRNPIRIGPSLCGAVLVSSIPNVGAEATSIAPAVAAVDSRAKASFVEEDPTPIRELSGMNLISESSVTSFSSRDARAISLELDAIPISLSALTLKPPSIMANCNIPLASFSFPDPRISISEESSLGSSFIAYDLRNRTVTLDPLQGLGKRSIKDSNKGGGAVVGNPKWHYLIRKQALSYLSQRLLEHLALWK